MALVEGEYGDKSLLINTKYNLNGNTGLNLSVLRPDGTGFSRDENFLTVGAVDVLDDDGVTIKAFEYVIYVLQSGDLNQSNRYKFQLTANGVVGLLSSVIKYVDVKPKLKLPA